MPDHLGTLDFVLLWVILGNDILLWFTMKKSSGFTLRFHAKLVTNELSYYKIYYVSLKANVDQKERRNTFIFMDALLRHMPED